MTANKTIQKWELRAKSCPSISSSQCWGRITSYHPIHGGWVKELPNQAHTAAGAEAVKGRWEWEAGTCSKIPFSLGENCSGCAAAQNSHMVKWDSPVRVQVVVPSAIAGFHILVVKFSNLHHMLPKKSIFEVYQSFMEFNGILQLKHRSSPCEGFLNWKWFLTFTFIVCRPTLGAEIIILTDINNFALFIFSFQYKEKH